MKRKILLLILSTSILASARAQKAAKTAAKTTGYAITATEKGGRGWREVRLVDIQTGEPVKVIYDSKQETEPLNARTGKPVEKKDVSSAGKSYTTTFTSGSPVRKVVDLDQVLDKNHHAGQHTTYTRVVVVRQPQQLDKPFSTNSAAMAYDKKHERLYYTPMSINQLRYIDLKSGKIYYFENEDFGTVKHGGDVANQITRMVIASDGNGYALTNDANHLIRFTTGKKPEITDLGALTDDAANLRSVHSGGGYGGDMIADASGNLYLVTANRNVFKINIASKQASHLGTIKGLPGGFSTNGAMVEEDSKVIVASSESTLGYYRFDLNTLQAEKVSGSPDVFNASDLANGNLAFDKKKKNKKDDTPPVVTAPETETAARSTEQADQLTQKGGITVFPNPVTNGLVRLSFQEQPAGRYQVQLLDLSGRLVGQKEINVVGDGQVETFKFPELNVKGNYLLRVTSEANKVNSTHKIVVQ